MHRTRIQKANPGASRDKIFHVVLQEHLSNNLGRAVGAGIPVALLKPGLSPGLGSNTPGAGGGWVGVPGGAARAIKAY